MKGEQAMRVKLEKGRALVLVGCLNCGIGVARQLAAAEGPFVHIDARDLESEFQNWLNPHIKTIICKGLPTRVEAVTRLKRYVSNDQIEVNHKNRLAQMMPTPNFIFTTGDADALPLTHEDRRFMVVRMDDLAGGAAQPPTS